MKRIFSLIILITLHSISGYSTDPLIQATNYNIIPPSPGVAELGRFGEINVMHATGIPDINIPIYTLLLDEVKVPIDISYNANGVRVTDVATEVGLKWNLNTGGIVSRSIRGLADDKPTYGWFNVPSGYQASSSWRSAINCYQDQMRALSENLYDPLPDMYTYVLNGNGGSFLFDRSKNLFKDLKNELKIEPSYDANGTFSKFIIKDKFGSQYEFGGTGYTESCVTHNHNILGLLNDARSTDGITSWRLKKIITRSNNEINFTYQDYHLIYSLPSEEVYYYKPPTPPPPSEAYNEYVTEYDRYVKLLTKIETSSIKVEFIYTLDNSASFWQQKLTEIKITDKILLKSRSFILEYEYFSGSARLRLKRIKEKGTAGGINDKITTFNYDTRTLAGYNSKSVDYFGFFNNASNGHYIPVVNTGTFIDTTANRDVVAAEITRGILTEIVYPTGGKTKFYFEPNKGLNTAGKIIYAPGVRVLKIEDVETDNAISNTREFTYSGLVGNTQIRKEYPSYKRLINACLHNEELYYSTPVLDHDPINGYVYKNVAILYKTRSGNPSHKIVEEYQDYYSNKSITSRLSKQFFYKAKRTVRDADTLVRSVENTWTGGSVQTNVYAYGIGPGCMLGSNVLCNQSNIFVETYYTELLDIPFKTTECILLSNSVTKDYIGINFLRVEKIYTYNSYYQLTNSVERMNTTEEYHSIFTYPNNYSDPVLQQLLAINAVALPVTQTLNKVVLGTANTYDKVKYDYNSQGNIIKEYIFNNSTSDKVELKREYSYIPNSNKISQIKARGNHYTTYLWSYNSNFPVAKVEGASEADIGTLGINISTLRSSVSESYIKSTVTQLKNLLSAGKTATTYLYDPIYGVTESKDFNDISTFYSYDEFGRLRLIKEYNSYIKNRFIYNYGSN